MSNKKQQLPEKNKTMYMLQQNLFLCCQHRPRRVVDVPHLFTIVEDVVVPISSSTIHLPGRRRRRGHIQRYRRMSLSAPHPFGQSRRTPRLQSTRH